MEKLPLYWAIAMGLVIGLVFAGGVTIFALEDLRRSGRSLDAVGGLALAVLCAMAYAPFFNRWFDDKMESRWLREALYSRRLEDLSHYMAVCRMGGRSRVADRLLALWEKHSLEPGWRARAIDPAPLFK